MEVELILDQIHQAVLFVQEILILTMMLRLVFVIVKLDSIILPQLVQEIKYVSHV